VQVVFSCHTSVLVIELLCTLRFVHSTAFTKHNWLNGNFIGLFCYTLFKILNKFAANIKLMYFAASFVILFNMQLVSDFSNFVLYCDGI